MIKDKFDAVIVGSGPNGLAAAIALKQAGLYVLIVEEKDTIGGGTRTEELTLSGFRHDVCSAIHPMAIHSPFLSTLPLERFGLEYLHSPVVAAHPFDNEEAAFLMNGIDDTAFSLGIDKQAYYDLISPVVENWDKIINDILAPFRFPAHPQAMAAFGLRALQPAARIVRRFKGQRARGLWAGMAGHSIQSLENWTTAAIGLVLTSAAHIKGWPLSRGGSAAITTAMANYFLSIGGRIETNRTVKKIEELPSAKAYLLDVTPKQLLGIAGHHFSEWYKKQLQRYQYGMGVFKIDWALSEPIPFKSAFCRQAATVHIGGTYEEIAYSEQETEKGKHVEKPFVLLSQQSLFDSCRAPVGKHTAWAYCHVPNASQKDMTTAIENQIERFAPGFKDIILAKHSMNTVNLQTYNPNYVGGDINGGVINLRQLYTRPAIKWTPYKTSAKDIYICSSSTPPGGGVHGMCGYYAAQAVLKNCFS